LTVKRHPQEHRKFVALLLLAGVIFLQNLYGLAVSDATASSAGESHAVFRYTTGAAGSPDNMRCVASTIADLWMVTAAHCLIIDVAQLSILCRDVNGQWRVAMASIDKLVQHMTHDVALVKLTAPLCNCQGVINLDATLPDTDTFIVPVLANSASKDLSLRYARVKEVARDAHTIRVWDSGVCLQQGDSGMPIFERNTLSGWGLAAVLIAGAPDCQGVQTAVRLDNLMPWIGQITQE
jgi:trypsin